MLLKERVEKYAQELEELKDLVAFLQQRIVQLETENSSLKAENKELRAEIERLKKGTNSANSSVPPSKDIKRDRIKSRSLRKRSGRKPGGQKGRKGSQLEMSENPDQVVQHSLSHCSHCQLDLTAQGGMIGRRAQVHDIPPIKIQIIEHQQVVKVCPCCGHENRGIMPEHIGKAPAQYGPNIKFLICYLSVFQYISMNRIRSLIQVLTNRKISTGFINNSITQIASAFTHTHEKILKRVVNSKVVGSDETGCRIKGLLQWMWIWTTTQYRYITSSSSRGYQTIKQVLGDGDHKFTLVSDCWAAQMKTKCEDKQICLVHLLRDCNKLIDHYSSSWARELKRNLERVISLSREHVHDTKYKTESRRLKKELDKLLQRKLSTSTAKVRTLRDRLRKYQSYLTTCLDTVEVPAHNNFSEQGIRNIKVKVKVSTGFRTSQGAEDYAIIRSVVESAILQKKNPFEVMKNPSLLFQ